MLSLAYALQQISNALVVGSFYSLLAVSYALVHGLTNRIVLSFGDMAMFAAFCAAYGALIAFSLGVEAGAAMIIAMAAAAVCSAALGRFAYGSVFAPLLGVRSQALLIASASLGLVIQEVMRLQSRGREQWLEPILNSPLLEMSDGGFALRVTTIQALIVAVTFFLIACLFGVLRLTRLGRLWRACSQDRALSVLLGVDVQLVTATAFVLAAVFAGAAGFTLAIYYGGVSFSMGLMLGLKALFASMIGGFGTIAGAVAGAFVLAALETAWTTFFNIGYRDVAVFGLVLVLLTVRPEGLLGVTLRSDSDR